MGACRQWPCLVESDMNLAAAVRQSTRRSVEVRSSSLAGCVAVGLWSVLRSGRDTWSVRSRRRRSWPSGRPAAPIDLRESGTGNPGSANALKVLGRQGRCCRARRRRRQGCVGLRRRRSHRWTVGRPPRRNRCGCRTLLPRLERLRRRQGRGDQCRPVPRHVPRVLPDRRRRRRGHGIEPAMAATGVRRHAGVVGAVDARVGDLVAAQLAEPVGSPSDRSAPESRRRSARR